MEPEDDLLRTNPPDAPSPRWLLPGWLPVRGLQARHRKRMLTHLLALSEFDRHRRFGQVATDEQIRGYVDRIDFARDELFGVFDMRLRLVAVAHLAYGADAGSAAGCSTCRCCMRATAARTRWWFTWRATTRRCWPSCGTRVRRCATKAATLSPT